MDTTIGIAKGRDWRAWLVFAAAVVLCNPGPAVAQLATVNRVDGVPNISNQSQPRDGVTTIELEELWRIGGDTDDPDEFFGVISQIVHDGSGNIYLLDVQLDEVKIFGPDGAFVRNIGRAGEGPGEFQRPTDLFLTASGQVAVLQRFPGKIVMLTPEGDPAGDYPLPEVEDGGFRVFTQARRAGPNVVLDASSRAFDDNEIRFATRLIAVDAMGQEVGHYLDIETVRSTSNMVIEEKGEGRWGMKWEVDDAGRVYLSPNFDDYRIEVLNDDGTTDKVIERAYEPRDRSAKERARAEARYRPRGRFGSRAEYRVSHTDRSIQQMYPQADETLWVLSSRGAMDPPAGALGVFDVFDPDGTFARQVQLMGEGDVRRDGLFFKGDRLYVVTGLQDAIIAMRGGAGEELEEEEEEPEPVAVICYRLEDGLP